MKPIPLLTLAAARRSPLSMLGSTLSDLVAWPRTLRVTTTLFVALLLSTIASRKLSGSREACRCRGAGAHREGGRAARSRGTVVVAATTRAGRSPRADRRVAGADPRVAGRRRPGPRRHRAPTWCRVRCEGLKPRRAPPARPPSTCRESWGRASPSRSSSGRRESRDSEKSSRQDGRLPSQRRLRGLTSTPCREGKRGAREENPGDLHHARNRPGRPAPDRRRVHGLEGASAPRTFPTSPSSTERAPSSCRRSRISASCSRFPRGASRRGGDPPEGRGGESTFPPSS